MTAPSFSCKQCGSCCLNLDGYETTCSAADVRRWERQGRYDILAWVESCETAGGRVIHEVWVNPDSGEPVTRCPWLRKQPRRDRYLCRINDTKPERCRWWTPDSHKHARDVGCQGFVRKHTK
ncbi:hypothetical protein ACFL43_06685 [Thermodesulfobacteriota bacterium]